MDKNFIDNYLMQRSQKYFTSFHLSLYDLLVLKLIAPLAWGCPIPILKKHYQKYISSNHLEVGVGTGYMLEHCDKLCEHTRLGLLDINQNCLSKSKKRLARYNPEVYLQDILQPIRFETVKFNSIALNFVMHCVPGHYKEKGIAFARLKAILRDEGVIFGASLMWQGVEKNLLSKVLMRGLNRIGVFQNTIDSPAALYQSLEENFNHVEVKVVGSAVLFSARD